MEVMQGVACDGSSFVCKMAQLVKIQVKVFWFKSLIDITNLFF